MGQAMDSDSLDEADIVDNTDKFYELYDELYRQCATANRLTENLCSRLEKLGETKRSRLVSRKKHGVTPLFLSAKRGTLAIVKYLLVKCKADVNTYCKSYTIIDAEMTALMETQSVNVARCLLENGAEYISTALRWQICRLRLEVVDFLVSKGAHINDEPLKKGERSLDYAQNNPQKYELLLKYGANVNARNALQDTPMHTAVKEDQLWQIKQLMKYGADPKLKNLQGDDVLRLSCRRGHEHILEYLMDNVDYSDVTRTNAYELMGAAHFTNNELHFNLKPIGHWKTALKIRLNNGEPFLERDPIEEPQIIDVSEFRSEDDLDRISNSSRAILFQVLLIKHRILGYNDIATIDALYDVYSKFNVKYKFKQALHFIMHIVHIVFRCNGVDQRYRRESSLQATLVILNIVDNDGIQHMDIHFDDILTIVGVLWSQFVDPMVDVNVYNATTVMLDLLLKMPKSEHQLKMFKNLVTKMVRKKFCNDNGRSLLHVIVSSNSTQCISCPRHLIPFPQRKNWNIHRLAVVQLLLECGHDVDALDRFESTPLHLVVSNECDLDLVNYLLEHGAHIDRINVDGIRPCRDLDTVPGFNTFNHVTLKCLAARTVVNHKVPTKHLKFPALETFIAMH